MKEFLRREMSCANLGCSKIAMQVERGQSKQATPLLLVTLIVCGKDDNLPRKYVVFF